MQSKKESDHGEKQQTHLDSDLFSFVFLVPVPAFHLRIPANFFYYFLGFFSENIGGSKLVKEMTANSLDTEKLEHKG
ncbi:hypothetical protein SDJN03_17851, partial [Cucurbita argyrosperma subsp. sororia]